MTIEVRLRLISASDTKQPLSFVAPLFVPISENSILAASKETALMATAN